MERPPLRKGRAGGCVVRVSNEFFLSPTVLLESLTTLSGGSGSTVDTCDYCGAGSSQRSAEFGESNHTV